jgi:hypothetical protein
MTAQGRLWRFDQASANGRNRRIHVIAAHSGEGPFIVRFADLCQRVAFDFRLRLAATEYSADLALA